MNLMLLIKVMQYLIYITVVSSVIIIGFQHSGCPLDLMMTFALCTSSMHAKVALQF